MLYCIVTCLLLLITLLIWSSISRIIDKWSIFTKHVAHATVQYLTDEYEDAYHAASGILYHTKLYLTDLLTWNSCTRYLLLNKFNIESHSKSCKWLEYWNLINFYAELYGLECLRSWQPVVYAHQLNPDSCSIFLLPIGNIYLLLLLHLRTI